VATPTEQVRSLTQDRYTYDRASAIADGVRADFDLPNSPIVPNSETVTVNGVAKSKPTDYTVDDGVGVVTFVAAPAASQTVVVRYRWSILSDADVQTFLDLNASDVKLAAADALDAIASSEALVQKVIRVLDVSTDGAAVARALRDHAAALRETVVVADTADGAFGWAEMVLDRTTYWELLNKRAIAGS
jgi:hypothetical protein